MNRPLSKIQRLSGRGLIVLSASSQTITGAILALGSVAILRIATHNLGPQNYGLYALIVIYVNLVATLADLGIAGVTTRDMAKEGADKSTILGVTLSSRVVVSIIAIPFISGTAFVLYPHEPALFRVSLAITSLDVLFNALQTAAGSVFAVRVRGDYISLMNVSARTLYLCGVIVAALCNATYLGYIVAYVVADMLVAILALVGAYRSVPFRWNPNLREWWRAIATAVPLGAIQLANSIYSWVDSLLVSILRSSVELGYYSISFNVINVLLAIPGFLVQALIPTLVNAEPDEVERLLNRAIYILVCIGAPMTTGGIILRKDIVLVIAGPRFLPATGPLSILLLCIPISFFQIC